MPIGSKNAVITEFGFSDFDAMIQPFIDPVVRIGLGSLINVGAGLGEFVEIGPGAMILGSAKVGDFAQTGASAVVLPGVRVGENCEIETDSVVTRNIEGEATAYGVPCKLKVD